VKPDISKTLLICFGLGSTLNALTDSKSVTHVDVVDTSRDVLALSPYIYGSQNPLSDPRVNVTIDDGRHFLNETRARYDLVTAEPPPPRNAGVSTLYTREFFQLVYDHLTPNGMVTYWLPVEQMTREQTNSIITAFTSVFGNASLWSGYGLQLILLGSRNPIQPVSESQFSELWNNPKVLPELETLGLEKPGQLGTLFLGSGETLKSWGEKTEPLSDDYPLKLSGNINETVPAADLRIWYNLLLNPEKHLLNDSLPGMLPEAIWRSSKRYIDAQKFINRLFLDPNPPFDYVRLHQILTTTDLKFPVLLAFGSDPDIQHIVDKALGNGLTNGAINYHLAARYLAERNYPEAERQFALCENGSEGPERWNIACYRMYLLLMSGKKDNAVGLFQKYQASYGAGFVGEKKAYLKWLEKTFAVKL